MRATIIPTLLTDYQGKDKTLVRIVLTKFTMNYQVTILNVIGYGTFSIALFYSIVNSGTLTNGEGWGMVGMVGIMGLAGIGITADYLIQRATENHSIKNRSLKRNVYGIVFMILAAIYIYIHNNY